MKKYLLSFTMVLATGLGAAFGQCTPDPQYTQAGVYPDSATGLSDGAVGVAYSELITVVVPADTTVEIFPGNPQTISMDSVNVTDVQGLPPGLSYACNPMSCSFPGDEANCLIITGTPTTLGNFPLVVETDAYVGGTGTPVATTVSYYEINIGTVSVPEMSKASFELLQNQPNPANGYTEIRFISSMPDTYTLEVVDILGKKVLSKQIKATSGTNRVEMNTSELRQGIYLYSLTNGKQSKTRRMVVNK